MLSFRSLNVHIGLLLAVLLLTGCFGPERIAPPEWAPEEMADSAMELNDANSDGELDEEELEKAPGLRAALDRAGQESADNDGSKSLSRDEIRDRIQIFEDSQRGLQKVGLTILLDRKPLGGASVTLEPEGFLSGTIDSVTGVTRQNGKVRPEITMGQISGIQPGLYRVKVTHPEKQIPSKYNEETTLGVDLSPAVHGYGSDDRFVFKLKSK